MLKITIGSDSDSAPAPIKWVGEGGVGAWSAKKKIISSPAVDKRRIPLQAELGNYVGIFRGLESISDVPPSKWLLIES